MLSYIHKYDFRNRGKLSTYRKKTLILNIDTTYFFKNKKIILGSIKNISKNTLFYELGIEEFFENHWYEIVGDLPYPNGDSFAIYHIKSNSIKSFRFKPATLPNYRHLFRRLRFFIKYGTDYKSLNNKYSFKEFVF